MELASLEAAELIKGKDEIWQTGSLRIVLPSAQGFLVARRRLVVETATGALGSAREVLRRSEANATHSSIYTRADWQRSGDNVAVINDVPAEVMREPTLLTQGFTPRLHLFIPGRAATARPKTASMAANAGT